MRHRPFTVGVALPALLATRVGLPGHEALWSGHEPIVGSHQQEVRPHVFLDLKVTAPHDEPELSLREAAIVLLGLVVFVALMAWAAMQWM